MKILLFGGAGQVGQALQSRLGPFGDLIVLDRHSKPYVGDLTDLDGIARTVADLAPDIVVNSAAYTAVDKAEREQELAYLINAQAPAMLADAVRKIGAWLVHYSTDYVFDGGGHLPWRVDDVPAPINIYGHSKLDGENLVRQSGCKHLIFRTSWVHAPHGHNFVKTILRLAGEREQLDVIYDQTGSPTAARLIAEITCQAIKQIVAGPEQGGIYHLTAAGETSWYDYARFIVETAASLGASLTLTAAGINPVPSSQFPTPARRPLNSRLDTSLLRKQFQLDLPDWQAGVVETIRALVQK